MLQITFKDLFESSTFVYAHMQAAITTTHLVTAASFGAVKFFFFPSNLLPSPWNTLKASPLEDGPAPSLTTDGKGNTSFSSIDSGVSGTLYPTGGAKSTYNHTAINVLLMWAPLFIFHNTSLTHKVVFTKLGLTFMSHSIIDTALPGSTSNTQNSYTYHYVISS